MYGFNTHDYITYGFSSTKKAFEEDLQTATTKKYTEDENGKKVEAPVSQHFYNMDLVPIYALSEKEAEHILAAIENAKPISKETSIILEIIMEESQGYFYGSKTLDEVLTIIQSRVQLYLDENN